MRDLTLKNFLFLLIFLCDPNISLPSNRFDFIVCRATFKSFDEPIAALDEMHRLLRPGGATLIMDLRREAARTAIGEFVDNSGRSWWDAWMTKILFRHTLVPASYSTTRIRSIAARSRFGTCTLKPLPMTYEALFRKEVD